MYKFQIIAHTHTGESIGLVGSTPELGLWDITKSIPLRTNANLYPLWWTEIEIDITDIEKIEYKYVRVDSTANAEWEALGLNRWLPMEKNDHSGTIVDDGAFGYLQPYPFAYIEKSPIKTSIKQEFDGLKIVVIGSSVASGYKSWFFKGWAWELGETLQQKYGHQLVNVSQLGANVGNTIARFPAVVTPQKPDVVIIALSLGNEGLAYCPPHERRAAQRRFESGLQQLVKMTRELGAIPILGGVYPHNEYSSEHYWLLKDTHNRMLSWNVPILDWLAAVDNGQGRWKEGISFDPAHPNTIGHHLMYEAIDLSLFAIDQNKLAQEKQRFQQNPVSIFLDNSGFHLSAKVEDKRLRISNPSKYKYSIAPYWEELQTALQNQTELIPGIYISKNTQKGTLPYLELAENRTITTTLHIPPGADLEYISAFSLFSPHNSQLLFYDGNLGILKESESRLIVINESDHDYNLQPMWTEIRNALKAMPSGVYHDPLDPDAAFRTMMIGEDGLESRVKIPPKSAVFFQYICKLTDISRVAILPLGDRCAVRMMLYKMEYDGPAFPFDLTRTTNIGDVADAIAHGFEDMWNPAFLHYSADAGRIYHSKWSGLSFAHEVEDTEDPVNDMSPVHERMRVRYSARSERFWYALQHCDQVLFIRTGKSDRNGVIDLVSKLEQKCQGKPFQLLLLSPQSSDEFSNLPKVLHYNVEFNPDRMYADLGHWMYCTDVMRSILESLGVSSKNLFWCPPKIPKKK
ncbi:DUF1796 family putative cysteine peptidase [Cronbergia sp. UHCC 0137]|uniref:DUF1796 family putative cysteine peptidase n=1 Tax=Cronbergia sp. UHCC 0137 TaxID=3110239 RepID=UPI002B1ED62D|nr:DUF1796 family putative cysteine peptidase [Cronbergia sp. UHCC 0137]MEA5621163.1 DUF1796 family putative cysteine peptidase [Cronbergia sp. UHCC 0137]